MLSKQIDKRAAVFAVTMAVTAASMSGCVTTGTAPHESSANGDPFLAFSRGETRLTCGLACAWADGGSRQKYRALFQQENWRVLALEVIRIGHEKDRNYYYLGRAAEGLGLKDSARVYYRIALSNGSKCGGSINVCDGFSFPAEIMARQDFMDKQAAAEVSAKQAADQASRKAAADLSAKQAADNRSAELARQRAGASKRASKLPVDQTQKPSTEPFSGKSEPDEANSKNVDAPKKPAAGNVRSVLDL